MFTCETHARTSVGEPKLAPFKPSRKFLEKEKQRKFKSRAEEKLFAVNEREIRLKLGWIGKG